jgi:C4-dicarboxylate-specific signal transduction histidine kinase
LLPGPRLRVCDDGAPVPAELAEELFRGPVSSESGLGVGLYQAAAFAAQTGCALVLAKNSKGAVCFELGRRGLG